MVNFIAGIDARQDAMLEYGKEGQVTLIEIANAWRCSAEKVATYLHRLQQQNNCAYLVDGKGRFRVFKDM